MFKALVLACLIGNPDYCIEFENARHPLSTIEACKERTIEMANDINELTPYRAVSWKCLPIKQGRLT